MERSLRLLHEGFGELLVVVKDKQQTALYRQALRASVAGNRLRIVSDEEHGSAGPYAALSGVSTALAAARNNEVTVLPVDQVGVRSLHLELLKKAKRAAAFFDDADDSFLPFPSLWSKDTLEPLRCRMAAGSFSVKAALADFQTRPVGVGAFLPELSINTNTWEELRAYFGSPLFDRFGRRMHYLRFSLIEACNMSCHYCLPEGFPEWYRHKAKMDHQSIATLLSGFRQLGFRKVRFTGGEPTLHPNCLDAIKQARLLGYEAIAMTTNAALINTVDPWINAGLTQINISLDSLNPETFHKITKSSRLPSILRVIDDFLAAGTKVKINTVLLRSVNSSEAEELIQWALERPLSLRFIELMPTKLNASFVNQEQVRAGDLLPLVAKYHLQPLAEPKGISTAGPAAELGNPAFPGRIGFINPLSCNFCDRCNRLRVTAKGAVKLCLFGNQDTPLDLSNPGSVEAQMRGLIHQKDERHHLETGDVGNVETFRNIGG